MGQPRVRTLGQELAKLEKIRLRTFRNESAQAKYLLALVRLVNRYVFRGRRGHAREHIYGRLYWARPQGVFVRQLRKDDFEMVRPIRVVSGYGLRKIERVLLQLLVTEVSTPQRRNRP